MPTHKNDSDEMEVTKDVQNEGWHFNKEDHVLRSPDSNGNYTIPTDYLKV